MHEWLQLGSILVVVVVALIFLALGDKIGEAAENFRRLLLYSFYQQGRSKSGWELMSEKTPRQGTEDNKKRTGRACRWLRFLVIILIGNALYFAAMPYLPPAARHQRFQLDLGTLVDFWFCLVVFGVFELVDFLRKRSPR